jgi:hypothetical protein
MSKRCSRRQYTHVYQMSSYSMTPYYFFACHLDGAFKGVCRVLPEPFR